MGELSRPSQVTWVLPEATRLWENWIVGEDIEIEVQLYALGTWRGWEKAGVPKNSGRQIVTAELTSNECGVTKLLPVPFRLSLRLSRPVSDQETLAGQLRGASSILHSPGFQPEFIRISWEDSRDPLQMV